jgi:hypothetical protein
MSYSEAIRNRLEADGYVVTEAMFAGSFKITAEKEGAAHIGEAGQLAMAYLALSLSVRGRSLSPRKSLPRIRKPNRADRS